ncbi:hypothetical protein [Komagataeibacter sp. FXV3]|uniref:hypothetical protein n=1 Tax=Komagataeibacter sp. FXV3 TaxID=2608998 RepID=UPI00187B60F1|nr:hypothetical protein [Komagataeibacter sp. FXV3]MBE7731197.1 hypothetical protein [Komagataeibacter sp. FXV3]
MDIDPHVSQRITQNAGIEFLDCPAAMIRPGCGRRICPSGPIGGSLLLNSGETCNAASGCALFPTDVLAAYRGRA